MESWSPKDTKRTTSCSVLAKERMFTNLQGAGMELSLPDILEQKRRI